MPKNELPYDVNSWVPTEGFIAELAKTFPDFEPSSNEVIHLVDILGRIIPIDLAEDVVKARDRRLEVMVVRMRIQRLLGLSDKGYVTEPVQWACTKLMGSY